MASLADLRRPVAAHALSRRIPHGADRLPGSLPSFIVLLLPVLGLHGLATAMPTMPNEFVADVSLLALVGALYGAIKALAQSRVRLLLAYGSLSFFSMLWWFVAGAHHGDAARRRAGRRSRPRDGGLLVAWQVIRTRYGDDVDPQAISGLASTMPQYAVLLSLLALAAMGLPPFGVFAGFMGLLLTAPPSSRSACSSRSSPGSPPRGTSCRWCNSCSSARAGRICAMPISAHPEFTSLLIVVLALLALGLAPTSLFAPDQTHRYDQSAMEHRSHGTARAGRPTSNPDEWNCAGSSAWRAKSSRSTGRCGPSSTTIHCIALNILPFEETVRRGKQFMGGNGYLPSQLYREYLKSGRIRSTHLDAALKPLVRR